MADMLNSLLSKYSTFVLEVCQRRRLIHKTDNSRVREEKHESHSCQKGVPDDPAAPRSHYSLITLTISDLFQRVLQDGSVVSAGGHGGTLRGFLGLGQPI